MSEHRRYRKFTAQQKTELVLASLRGPKTITELCREHDISDSLLRKWREQFLAAGAERLSGKPERTETGVPPLRRTRLGLRNQSLILFSLGERASREAARLAPDLMRVLFS
jgi:transposase-like protein